MNLVGYVRVSTTEQAIEGLSLDAQRRRLADYCAGAGHVLVESFADEGMSGTREDRPGLLAAFAALRRRDVDGLIVTQADRLSRNLRHLLGIVEDQIRSKTLIVVRTNFDYSTPEGKMLLSVGGSMAELERRIIGRRISKAMRHLRAQHRYTGGEVRYGFTATPGGDLVEDEYEQRVLALAKQLRGEGRTYREVAAILQGEGHHRRGGASWTHGTVWNVLREDTCKSER